jgi:hypothetical protein
MRKSSHIVFWNNKEIGIISNCKVDNFDFYGNWHITASPELYSAFLTVIDNEENGAYVEFGEPKSKLKGNVLVEPDDEIEIKMYPE